MYTDYQHERNDVWSPGELIQLTLPTHKDNGVQSMHIGSFRRAKWYAVSTEKCRMYRGQLQAQERATPSDDILNQFSPDEDCDRFCG